MHEAHGRAPRRGTSHAHRVCAGAGLSGGRDAEGGMGMGRVRRKGGIVGCGNEGMNGECWKCGCFFIFILWTNVVFEQTFVMRMYIFVVDDAYLRNNAV